MLKRQDDLFKKWSQGRDSFISDGIVDEEEYRSAHIKLLFLLKEVNGGGNRWDLCEFLRTGGRAQTWDNIARWIEGIFNLEREISWCELASDRKTNEDRRIKYLKKICAVNLKKTPGGHTSVQEQISQAAQNDSKWLKAQISIYEPEIIICCGTGNEYEKEIAEQKLDWQMTTRGIWYADDNGRIIISYAHPEARVQNNLLYYGLVDAVREIIANKS